MQRRPWSYRLAAISRPLVLPPTNDRQVTASCSTSASLNWPPEPLTSDTGSPARRAAARHPPLPPVQIHVPPLPELVRGEPHGPLGDVRADHRVLAQLGPIHGREERLPVPRLRPSPLQQIEHLPLAVKRLGNQ